MKVLVWALLALGAQEGPTVPQKVVAPHLPNAYRLHERVISGGLPEGEAAFRELQQLGVRTIISVDGAQPDVDLARKFGLRYVHLPHGYDGIPESRSRELAKAVRDLPGPVYVHCHHGKHRSPAAATVACVAVGFLDPSQAVSVLKTAGTSESYRGLYQSAAAARRLDPRELNELAIEFRESVELPPLAEAMVAIENVHDHLKEMADNAWGAVPRHPDLTAAHEALLLREHFTELLRTEATRRQPEAFQQMVRESELAARTLEQVLEDASLDEAMRAARARAAFDDVSRNCLACHRQFRDTPLGEKPARP
ncbi:MAG: hypothetical protein AB7F89_08400 [Pirellulaceae bacterium]